MSLGLSLGSKTRLCSKLGVEIRVNVFGVVFGVKTHVSGVNWGWETRQISPYTIQAHNKLKHRYGQAARVLRKVRREKWVNKSLLIYKWDERECK